MKIAICYSGLIRTLNSTIDSHKFYIFDKYDCDVFFHFWDIHNQTEGWHVEVTPDSAKLSQEYQLNIIEKLQPKHYKFESFAKKHDMFEDLTFRFGGIGNCNPKNSASMYYSIKESFLLMEEYQKNNNIEYDVTIRCRTDLLFDKEVDIFTPEENTFICPNIHMYPVNDQFFFSTMNTMKVIAELFDEIPTLQTMHPESILKMHLDKNKISIIDVPIHYHIIR